jgi:hypothetical protein
MAEPLDGGIIWASHFELKDNTEFAKRQQYVEYLYWFLTPC